MQRPIKRAIQIADAPTPIGPYSQAILFENTLFISGQIPLNPYTGALITESIEEATHQVIKNINALLKEAGMDLGDVLKCTIYLLNMDDFVAFNKIYADYFTHIPPARETVQVAKLPLGVSIEISCIAMKQGLS